MLGVCRRLAAVDEAMMACTANFMKALTVLDSLKNMPCQEGNVTVLTRLAYDMVSAEPQSSVSVLAGRVATAATQQGLIMAAPAGSFTIQQLQNVQQQLQPMQRTSQRPQGPPRMCWRCGAAGHMAGTCTAAVNPSNPFPFKPNRA